VAFKKFSVNEYLTAADTNAYFVQQVVATKTANESVTNSTTLQDDNHLVVSLQANTDYWMDLFLITDGATGGDIKFAVIIPSGTLRWITNGLNIGATGTTGSANRRVLTGGASITGSDVGTVGAGTSSVVPARGIARISSTGGNARLQWAQNTSSGTASRVLAGSFMLFTRVRT
jgi:hypothetical protein